jgi:hypothetical protein
MHFVVLAEHTAEVCPLSNARTKEMLLKTAPEIPGMAAKHSVTPSRGLSSTGST